jgi:hypothetical protein
VFRIDCTSGGFTDAMLFSYIQCDAVQFTQAWHCLKAVKEYFPYDRLLEITPSRIEAYQAHRLKQAWHGRVNLEVRCLQRGYRLLFDTHEISYVPRVKLLECENVRESFSTARSLKPTKAQFLEIKRT